MSLSPSSVPWASSAWTFPPLGQEKKKLLFRQDQEGQGLPQLGELLQEGPDGLGVLLGLLGLVVEAHPGRIRNQVDPGPQGLALSPGQHPFQRGLHVEGEKAPHQALY